MYVFVTIRTKEETMNLGGRVWRGREGRDIDTALMYEVLKERKK